MSAAPAKVGCETVPAGVMALIVPWGVTVKAVPVKVEVVAPPEKVAVSVDVTIVSLPARPIVQSLLPVLMNLSWRREAPVV